MSMPSPGTPCVLLIVSCGCHRKNRCRPPRGVMPVSVAIAGDEFRPKWKTVDALYGVNIDVEHPHIGNFAGRNANHGVGEARPPGPHLRFVAAGILEAVHGKRTLVLRVAGKHRNPQRQCIMKGGVQDGADVVHLVRCGSLAVSVGVQSILPPNRRMNRSLSHFACAGEGVLRYSSCSAMLSMKSKSRPWKRRFFATQYCAISCHE